MRFLFAPIRVLQIGLLTLLFASVMGCLIGCVTVQPVADNCFPSDTTISDTIGGNFFVGFARKEDPETHANPTSPTIHFKGRVVSGDNILRPGEDTLGGITVYNQSVFLMEGGDISGYVTAKDKSRVTLTGGIIRGVLEAQDTSAVTVDGGKVAFGMHVTQKGTLTVKKGQTCFPNVYDTGVLNLEGGKCTDTLTVGDSGTVNLRGGKPPAFLEVYGNATLNVYGENLKKTLIDAHSQVGRYSQYTLSGTLSDGTEIHDVKLEIENKQAPSDGTPKVRFIKSPVQLPE